MTIWIYSTFRTRHNRQTFVVVENAWKFLWRIESLSGMNYPKRCDTLDCRYLYSPFYMSLYCLIEICLPVSLFMSVSFLHFSLARLSSTPFTPFSVYPSFDRMDWHCHILLASLFYCFCQWNDRFVVYFHCSMENARQISFKTNKTQKVVCSPRQCGDAVMQSKSKGAK